MKQYLIGLFTGVILSSFLFFFMGQTNYKMKSWEARSEKSNDEIFSNGVCSKFQNVVRTYICTYARKYRQPSDLV